ncbi:MAG: hypothetical protein RQM92_04830 [Candidatus Syntrophopropionicum ammoniitolerans]
MPTPSSRNALIAPLDNAASVAAGVTVTDEMKTEDAHQDSRQKYQHNRLSHKITSLFKSGTVRKRR